MKQVRIGLIGIGLRSSIAKYWHQPNGESVVVAATDLSISKLKDFQEDINKETYITTNYKELLERHDVDAVVITTPDHLHEEHAIAAFRAGKHVYCEKPLAISVDGCDRILDEWEKSEKHLMIGFNMRYMNMFRTMKGIVDSGVIGDIKAVWVRHFVGLGGEYYYHDWHANSSNTNSLLLQKGSHDLDIIHWITGSYTKKVSAFGSLDFFGGENDNNLTCPTCDQKHDCTEFSTTPLNQCAFRNEVDVEDNNMVIMELEGGIKASYLQCHFTPDYQRNYTFIGTKGRIENSEPDGKVYVKTRKSNTWHEYADQTYDIKTAEGSHGGADPVICQDFVNLVLHNKQPLTTPYAGRMSVAVGCAASESIRAGGKVVQVTQRFGSEKAQSTGIT